MRTPLSRSPSRAAIFSACAGTPLTPHAPTITSSRYYCQLVAREAGPSGASTLSIVETNAFKQLTHLQLGLRAANDACVTLARCAPACRPMEN